jgi:hypothetical protein
MPETEELPARMEYRRLAMAACGLSEMTLWPPVQAGKNAAGRHAKTQNYRHPQIADMHACLLLAR